MLGIALLMIYLIWEEDTDEEDHNLFIDVSSQINSDEIQFSTLKPSKRKIMTRVSSKNLNSLAFK